MRVRLFALLLLAASCREKPDEFAVYCSEFTTALAATSPTNDPAMLEVSRVAARGVMGRGMTMRMGFSELLGELLAEDPADHLAMISRRAKSYGTTFSCPAFETWDKKRAEIVSRLGAK